jgi:ribosomal protein L32
MSEVEIRPCPECGSQRIHASFLGNAQLGVMPKNPPTIREVIINKRPNGLSKWLMKRSIYKKEIYNQPMIPSTHRSKLQAIVCVNCGYTTLHAIEPANLTKD